MPSIHILITFFIKRQILNRGIQCVYYIYIKTQSHKPLLAMVYHSLFHMTKRIVSFDPAAPLPEVFFQFSLDLLHRIGGAAIEHQIPHKERGTVLGAQSWKRRNSWWRFETWKTHGNHYKQLVKTWLKTCKTTKTYQKQTKKQQDINPFNLHQCFLIEFPQLNPLSVPHLINIQLSSDLNWMLWFHRPQNPRTNC